MAHRFGCRKVIYKLTQFGQCKVFDRAAQNLGVDWNVFRYCCILTGCDYLVGGLRGYGMLTSLGMSRTSKPLTRDEFLSRFDKVTEEFKEKFVNADNALLYHIIYDPRSGAQITLNPILEAQAA